MLSASPFGRSAPGRPVWIQQLLIASRSIVGQYRACAGAVPRFGCSCVGLASQGQAGGQEGREVGPARWPGAVPAGGRSVAPGCCPAKNRSAVLQRLQRRFADLAPAVPVPFSRPPLQCLSPFPPDIRARCTWHRLAMSRSLAPLLAGLAGQFQRLRLDAVDNPDLCFAGMLSFFSHGPWSDAGGQLPLPAATAFVAYFATVMDVELPSPGQEQAILVRSVSVPPDDAGSSAVSRWRPATISLPNPATPPRTMTCQASSWLPDMLSRI